LQYDKPSIILLSVADMFIIYSIIYSLIFIIALPFYIIYRKIKKKSSIKIKNRLGFELPVINSSVTKPIWIHAVSVGEVLASKPLILQLQKEYPDLQLVMSVTTHTGWNTAVSTFGDSVLLTNFPFDFGFSIKRYIRHFNPQLVIIMETELWPRFCRTVKKFAIPLILVNGRISVISFPQYRKMRFFLKSVLSCFNLLLVQTALYRERFIEIGADDKKIIIAPSLKYHSSNFELDKEQKKKFVRETSIEEKDVIITGGSTHMGEEDVLLSAFNKLSKDQADLKLIIAPRRPEHFADVDAMLAKSGLSYVKRSDPEIKKNWKIMLLDRMGELKSCYSMSRVVFVGGSLIPHGGQNLLEAAAFSVPVVFGPHIYNFLETADMLLDSGGGFMVRDERELHQTFAFLLKTPLECETAGKAARSVIDANQNGLDIVMSLLKKYIQK
jgi:3-deoxy-D-manno-octulosonic-acid transferase